jgi:hypothetical protein
VLIEVESPVIALQDTKVLQRGRYILQAKSTQNGSQIDTHWEQQVFVSPTKPKMRCLQFTLRLIVIGCASAPEVAVTTICVGPFGVAFGEGPLAPPGLVDVQLIRLTAATASNINDRQARVRREAIGLFRHAVKIPSIARNAVTITVVAV